MSEDHNAPVLIGTGVCRYKTKDACLVDIVEPDGREIPALWIPKSVIHGDSEVYRKGTTGKVVVQEWWAETRGIVALPTKRPLPMKPPSKKWLRDQKARMDREKR
jgi:hypothetical protein